MKIEKNDLIEAKSGTDVLKFLKDTKTLSSIAEAYAGKAGIQNLAQNNADASSVNDLAQSLTDIVGRNRALGYETTLIADRAHNSIKVIAHTADQKVDANGKIVSASGTKGIGQAKNAGEIAVYDYGLPERGGTRARGASSDAFHLITDPNNFKGTKLLHAEDAALAETKKMLHNNRSNIKTLKDLQRTYNHGKNSLSSTTGIYNPEERKEMGKEKDVGKSDRAKAVQSQQVFIKAYLDALNFQSKVRQDLLGQAFAILQNNENLNDALRQLNNEPRLRKAFNGKMATLERMFRDIKANGLSSGANGGTTKRYVNDNSTTHTAGTFRAVEKLINDSANETSRNQGINGLQPIAKKNSIYHRSNVSSSAEVKGAGREFGKAVQVGKNVPDDAVVRSIGVRPEEQAYEDVVYLNKKKVDHFAARDQVTKKYSMSDLKLALGKNADELIGENGEITEDNMDKVLKLVLKDFQSDKQKRKFDTKGASLKYDDVLDKFVLQLDELFEATSGTKIIDGATIKGSAYFDDAMTERMEKAGAAMAHVLPSFSKLNSALRKGTPLFQNFYYDLFQQYGEAGNHSKLGNFGLDFLFGQLQGEGGLTGDIASLMRDNMKMDEAGNIAPNYGELMDKFRGLYATEQERGEAFIEMMSIIDRLTNGVDADSQLLSKAEFENVQRYFSITGENGKRSIDYAHGDNAAEIIMFSTPQIAHEFPWGETDMSRMSRTLYYDLEDARKGGLIDDESYAAKKEELSRFVGRHQASEEDQAHLDRLKLEVEEAMKNSVSSVTQSEKWRGDQSVVRIGFGAGYDIDLSQVAAEEYDGSMITNYDDTLRAAVNAAVKAKIEAGMEDVKVMLDPGAKEAFALSDNDSRIAAKQLFLPLSMFDAAGLKDAAGDPRITEAYKSLSHAVQRYNKNGGELNPFLESMKEVVVNAASDVSNENGTIYSGLMGTKTKGSWGGKILPMERWMYEEYYNANFKNADIGEGKKNFLDMFMTEGAAVSAEKFRSILDEKGEDGESHKVSTAQLAKAVEYLSGEKTGGIGRDKLVDLLEKYLTLGSKENEAAIAGNKFNGDSFKSIVNLLFGRAPFSTLDSAEILSTFISSQLHGDATMVGLAPLFKTASDWDGDIGSYAAIGSADADIAETLKKQKRAMNRGLALVKAASFAPDTDFKSLSDEQVALMLNQDIASESATKQRLQKMATGPLALLRRNYSDVLQKNAYNGQAVSFDQLMSHTFFEAIAQDAISAKKVINSIIAQGNLDHKGAKDVDNLTQEEMESYEKGWTKIQELTGKQKSMDDVFGILRDIGLIDDKNMFSPEKKDILASALLKIGATKEGQQYLFNSGIISQEMLNDPKVFGENGFTDEFLTDKDGFAKLAKGINRDIIMGALTRAGEELGVGDAKGLFDLATQKQDASKVGIYDASQIKFTGESRILEENAKALEKSADSMDRFVGRLDRLISIMEDNARMTGAINERQWAKDWVKTDPRYDFGDDKPYWYASVSQALNRSWVFKGKLADENSPRTVSANDKGTFGHALFEANAKGEGLNGTIATKAENEFRGKLKQAGIEDKVIEETIGQVRKGVQEALFTNIKNGFGHYASQISGDEVLLGEVQKEFSEKFKVAGISDEIAGAAMGGIMKAIAEGTFVDNFKGESVAAEFGVKSKTGLHGVIDEIRTTEDGTVYLYDNKFTDHLPDSRYGAQLMLYKDMIQENQYAMMEDYGGDWNKRKINASKQTKEDVIGKAAVRMSDEAQRAEKQSLGRELTGQEIQAIKDTATELAKALWEGEKFVGIIRQVKSNGVVNEYRSTGMATKEMLGKVKSGRELTETEMAAIGALQLDSVHTPDGWESNAVKAERAKAEKEAAKAAEEAAKAQTKVAEEAAKNKAKAEADAQKELDRKFPVRSLSQLLRTGSTGMMIRKAVQYGHKAVAVTEALDKAMTNLRIVTGKTEEQAKTMMKTYGSMAKELGSTIDKVAKSAQEWLRQGYNVAETNKLVESSVYLSKLGFMDETQAVQSLTSAMKGFNLEASDSMSIVDKLTTLDAKYATTAGGLATAMSYTASVANEAGLSMDQTLAALTTIIDTTQMNSSAAGNAVKSMLSRFGNVKAGSMTSLEEGEDSEGINDIERVLGAIGIQVRSTSMEMRSFSDVLDDVAESWEHLSDVERNAVATAMAGTRQRNAFVTLLSHYDTYKQAVEDQKDADGTAEAKYATRKNSIEYLKERRMAAAQSVAESAELQNLIKMVIKVTTWLIERANKLIPLLISGISYYITMFSDRFKFEGGKLLEGIKALTKATKDNTEATKRTMHDRRLGHGLTPAERAKNAALSGVSTAVSYGMAGGGLLGNSIDGLTGVSEYENGGTNVMTGLLTGAGAAIGTVFGGPIGAAVGTIVADAISSGIKALILRDEKERGDRVKAAKEQLDALTEVKSSITTSSDLLKKDFASWDVSDWEKWNDAMDEMASNIKDGEFTEEFKNSLTDLGIESNDAGAALKSLADRTEDADKVMAAYQAAMLRREAELTWAAGEEERAQIYDQLNSKKTTDNEKVHLQKQLDDMDKVREKAYMQAAFLDTGYSTKNEAELYGVAVDNIIRQVAEQWAEDFHDIADEVFGSDGVVTKKYESTIRNYLKTQGNLESIMTGSNVSVARAKSASNAFDGYDINELRKLAKTRSGALAGNKTWESFLSDKGLTDDAARNLILNYNSSEMDRIANSLSMTREELDGISDKLWWMTSGDALGGFDKLNDKLGAMSEILADIVDDSQMSADNLKKLINQFPELVGQLNGDFSTDNIIKIMATTVASPEAMLTWTKAQVTRNLTDQSFWNTIKASYQENWSDLFGKDMTDSEGRLNTASSLSDVWDLIDESDNAKNTIASLMKTTLQTADFLNVVTDSLTEWQNKVYDDEIKNLQSIKDALGDTLKQREKELELIKAKQALENAQNEKKRVYMAGMGWTYVSDQQAVKEAQEKVDQLEREKTADNIQYQIDILEQQKDSLNEIKDAVKWDNLKKLATEITGAETGSTIGGIIRTMLDWKNGTKTEIEKSLEVADEVQKNNADLAVTDAKDSLNSAIDTLNGASNPTDYKEAKAGVDSAQAAYTEAVKNAKDVYDKYESTYDANDGTEFDAAIDEADAKAQSSFLTGANLFKNLPKGKYQIITDGNGRMRIKPYSGSGKYQIRSIGDGRSLELQTKLGGYDLYTPEEMATLNRGFIYGVKGEINFANLWGNPAELGIASNFAGTTSFAGGRTFVNERGLEGIITPNGTLTSLPAKSGILPADLTKNLWKLGEIAPNLVAQVRGNNLVPNAVGASNDNSLNVGTLNATFNTDQSFDGEKFWSQVRSQIVLTRNNH